ncbi:hypothetical protein Droror1_Dr00021842 [Drosera rotundifolia]
MQLAVESRGVLQFGSSKEFLILQILEDTTFVDEAKKLIQEIDNYGRSLFLEDVISCLLDETLNQSNLFAQKIPSQNSYSSDHSLIHDNAKDKPGALTAGPMTLDNHTLYYDGLTSTKIRTVKFQSPTFSHGDNSNSDHIVEETDEEDH